jgi:predicted nucleotidyltransferase
MFEKLPPARLEHFARIFIEHGVQFIVIGGQAEYIFGSPRVTYDTDLCYERSSENLARLAAALRQLDVHLRNAPPDLPFIIDARSLALGSNFTFTTSIGDLDLLGFVEPIGDFHALNGTATDYTIDNLPLRVIHLDDLIRIKQHINRSKDRESLLQLLAIKKLREQTGKE